MSPDRTSRGNLAFEALADPTRRAILRFLADQGESPVGQITAGVGTVTRSGVSNHLRFLRAAYLVRERRAGRYRLYSLDQVAVDEVVEFFAALYRGSLSDLKRQFEERTQDRTPAEGADRSGRTSNRQ